MCSFGSSFAQVLVGAECSIPCEVQTVGNEKLPKKKKSKRLDHTE